MKEKITVKCPKCNEEITVELDSDRDVGHNKKAFYKEFLAEKRRIIILGLKMKRESLEGTGTLPP